MHYTVAVFTEVGGRDVYELLAPYDENISVDPYIYKTKQELIDEGKSQLILLMKRREEFLKSGQTDRADDLNKTINERKEWTDEDFYNYYIEDYKRDGLVGENGEAMSCYNPDSKWDWYSIGGRWGGELILKNPDEDSGEYLCDSALASDIDWDRMIEEAKHGLESYAEARETTFYRKEYFDELYPNEEIYIWKNTHFTTYAVVTPDGEWHAPGEMGWFSSSETGQEETEWELAYHERFIEPAMKNGWHITLVDCHI